MRLKPTVERKMGSWAGLLRTPDKLPNNRYAEGSCRRCEVLPRQPRSDGTYHAYCSCCRKLYNQEYKARKLADKTAVRRKPKP